MRDIFKDSHWWQLPSGPANTLCDVPGVRVGHQSVRQQGICSGVTAVLPHDDNLFRMPVVAGTSILNGFGKSAGLVQLQELGEIETPILLTNTFGVPACTSAVIRHAIEGNPTIGRRDATVNALVMECNDGKVNDIQAMAVTEQDARQAIANAGSEFEQGSVGAGSGMSTFGFSGGIGTSSRLVTLPGGSRFTLGALVSSNFGEAGELRVFGQMSERPKMSVQGEPQPAGERGSIIMLLATDAPMDSRQLTRLSRRSGAALGRLGSFYGHGSGDITVAFSTANACRRGEQDVFAVSRLCESRMDAFFIAAVEAVEEAILASIWHAEPHKAHDGSLLPGFRQHWMDHLSRQ